MFFEDLTVLLAGLILLCGMMVIGEVLAKKLGWEE